MSGKCTQKRSSEGLCLSFFPSHATLDSRPPDKRKTRIVQVARSAKRNTPMYVQCDCACK